MVIVIVIKTFLVCLKTNFNKKGHYLNEVLSLSLALPPSNSLKRVHLNDAFLHIFCIRPELCRIL